jgi:ribokinase
VSGTFDVLVVGSVNRDHVCRMQVLPRPGQTVLGGQASVGSGGKGGNQAVAASRLGAATALVACVGDDDDGRALLADLVAAGVDTGAVTVEAAPTGVAFVLVAADGENAIAVAPGANDLLGADRATEAVRRLLAPHGVLVVQAEIPESASEAAIQAAADLGCRPVVNLAPYRPMSPGLLALSHPLVVNESEAGGLLGRVVRGAADAGSAAAELARRARSVVVTIGADGAVVAEGARIEHLPAERVTAVDSTGAGDAFTGALAAGLAAGEPLVEAVRTGVRAGTYAAARPGAQASFPDRRGLGLRPASRRGRTR